MSAIAEDSKPDNSNKASAVSGGKIWTPPEHDAFSVQRANYQNKKHTIIKLVVFPLTILFFVLSMIVLILHFTEPLSIPSTMSSVKIQGAEGYEFIMVMIMSVLAAVCLAIVLDECRIANKAVAIGLCLSILLLLVPSTASVLLVNKKAVEGWAVEQYGYEASYEDLEKYKEPIPAVDVETGEKVTIYRESIDGSVVLKEYANVPATEASDDLESIEKDGVTLFRDKATGEEYMVERIAGTIALTPYVEQETDGEK